MTNLRRFLIAALLVVLGGCGGGGGSTSSAPTQAPVPPPPVTSTPLESRLTKIILQSDAGDAIGMGQSYKYDLSDTKISVTSDHNRLVVHVAGDESWTGVYQTGGSEQTQPKPGMVADVPRYIDGVDWSKSGLTWWGEGNQGKVNFLQETMPI